VYPLDNVVYLVIRKYISLKKESDILQNMPAMRASFPMKYFGLPLSALRLKCVNFQPLKDKMASKLVTWEG
jgi:hypothetical protein